MAARWFTPGTARHALARIRPAVERVCALYRELETRRPERIQPDQRVDPGYFRRVEELHGCLGEVRGAGVELKDLKRGLVDFPARRDGRSVLLCWQVGESAIEHWHELEAGFAERQRLDEDGPWEADGVPSSS